MKWFAMSVMAIVLLSSVSCEAAKKSSAAEGTVVDAQGKPLAGVKVIALQQEPLKGYERIETKTKKDGLFILKGLYPRAKYKLSFEGGQCNDATENLTSAPAGETTMLRDKVVLKFSPFKKGSNGVVTDPRTGLGWVPAPDKAVNWYQAKQYVESLTLAGGGWRLPTRSELRELYNTGLTGCGWDALLGEGYVVWSSELKSEFSAWTFDFSYSRRGSEYANSLNFSNYNEHVIAVRSPK